MKAKKKIKIRRDDFVLNSLSNPWHEVIDDFCSQIDDLTKNDIADKLTANFSTTSKDSRVASQIVLMDAMQQYFEYHFSTMCGIPEIRLAGDKEDWEKVQSKANSLLELIPEFGIWFKSLNEILQNFIDAFDDKVDEQFWNEIYKVQGGSGGPYVSGWLIALFPYLADNVKNRYITEEETWRDAGLNMFDGLTTENFSYHMNKVPFTWNYHGNEIKMLFVGGLIGVLQENKSLVPTFGYAITEDKILTGEDSS